MKKIVRLQVLPCLLLWASVLPAQDLGSYSSKPKSHDQNKRLVTRASEGNRRNYEGNTNVLVRPGLVADKQKQRVEVMVESTGLGPNASCEFLLISEASDHAYEALLISFAKAIDIHRALQFIGTEPGEPFDPESLRFWAKGEPFVLSILRTNEPPLRLEQLLWDRHTGRTLPEVGFLFTGSKMVPSINDPHRKMYSADEYQPKSIVPLFNSGDSVLEVPGSAAKEVIYQNTVLNPERRLSAGSLLTLVIEPAQKDGSKRVKDLLLRVEVGQAPADKSLKGIERVAGLSLQLQDGKAVLNGMPNIISVIETLAALDRKEHDYYVKVSFGAEVELGQAQALAAVLATVDSEQGVRIEPPPEGQLHYRAFTPDPELLDREARIYQPWELAVEEKEGKVSGKLLLVESIWKPGASASELKITPLPVSSPENLRRELDAEVYRSRKAGQTVKPPVIMVFAPSTLQYGRLMKFLEPVLPTHRIIHLYLDQAPRPSPKRKPSP